MSGAPAKNPAGYVETVIDDETVVMSLDTGDFYSLKDTGRAIWDLIDGSRDEAALVAALAKDYPGADPATLAGDVASFVGELRGAGLLT